MKKILIGLAFSSLVLASCQKNSVEENVGSGERQLTFSPVLGKATTSKASEATLDYLKGIAVDKDHGFSVHAYKVVGNLQEPYFSEKLFWSTPKWETEFPRFFPATGALRFYSYVGNGTYAEPASTDATLATSAPTLGYTVNTTAATQEDLMVASYNLDNVTGAGTTTVALPYRHILSQVNFGVKGYTGATVKISGISVNANLKNTNTYTFGIGKTQGIWGVTPTGTAAAYQYGFATAAANQNQFTTTGADGGITANVYIFGDGGNWGPGKGTTTYYVLADGTAKATTDLTNNNKLGNSLILLPQDITNAKFSFTYELKDLGGIEIAKGNVTDAPLSNKDVTAWSPNKRYVYILDFTDFLDGRKLTFDVDLTEYDWENYNKPNPDDGIVYVPSLGKSIFVDNIKGLTKDGSYTMPAGILYGDIIWDWSREYMTSNAFVVDDQINIVFGTNISFNGKKFTIYPPAGFGDTPVDVNAAKTVTFKAVAASNPTALTTAAVAGSKIVAPSGILTATESWTLTAPTTPLVKGASFTFDVSKVALQGHTLTITAPSGYTKTTDIKDAAIYIITKN